MIHLVKRNQLDEKKYNDCIFKSLQSRVYAYSWYLDVVTDNWEVLVLDDYVAVMPLPVRKKFMISYISQPFFTQQLGVFSLESLSEEIYHLFIKKIPRKFLKIALQFNYQNTFFSDKLTPKSNYILSLNNDYKMLSKGFSKGRKHAITKGLKEQFTIVDISFEELLKLSKKHYSFKEFSETTYDKLIKLIKVLESKNKVKIVGIKIDNVLVGGSVFVLDAKRMIYLFSAVSQIGKEKQVMSLLLNDVIETHSNTDRILDFEGSQLPGVAKFFRSFGAIKETYFLYKKGLL